MTTVELTQYEAELITDCLRNRLANLGSPNAPNSAKQEMAILVALLNKLDWQPSIKAVGIAQANNKAV